MKSLYSIAVDTQHFIDEYVRTILQPKYECLQMTTNVTKQTNVAKIYNRALNMDIILETPSGKYLSIDDLTIEQIFALAIGLDCCEYTIIDA